MHADLHSHTCHSDGSLSPAQLVDAARDAGVEALAITDHDTVAGLDAWRRQDNRPGIRVIAGVEISASALGRGVHILGLGIDMDDPDLRALLAEQQRRRRERAEAIADRLAGIGITSARPYVDSLPEEQVICRTHLADHLIAGGHAQDYRRVFKKYLGKGGRAAVADNWISMGEAIESIRQAGGLAVLAHPTRYKLAPRQVSLLVHAFADAGGDGLELSYPNLAAHDQKTLARLAQTHSLSASGGSDFHSPDKPWARLGRFPALPEELETVFSRLPAHGTLSN